MQTHELLRHRRGEYGYDAPRQGLLPTGGGALVFFCLAAIHQRNHRLLLARLEFIASAFLSLWFAMYLHTTRRGKFLVWAEILSGLPLRGDEQVLDMGCGRGGVTAMIAKLVPRGHAVGLDLWTDDQSAIDPKRPNETLSSKRSTGAAS